MSALIEKRKDIDFEQNPLDTSIKPSELVQAEAIKGFWKAKLL